MEGAESKKLDLLQIARLYMRNPKAGSHDPQKVR
jgi:hypothetical protein